ncbi:DsbA family oxidoreductase [Nonomuraea diastatica]|uniref:DsbA family oxidoreductase n=1 Tax=Nonomuraea diastatica TaxID=1848329 RepID=A0A4V2YEC5_9ACTN|nr:DsbA family oxidoreductase [Nonomuraea diastatica]TDD18696.1 DsbA family oxidoreductase [Nonomuraea diastatica]
MTAEKITVRVELFSDMICPFCYIGKRRLDRALAEIGRRDEIEVVYRSFQLDPFAARVAGETLPEREMRFHGLSRETVDSRLGMVAAMAKEEGLDYDLGKALPVHTFDAHRLMHFAAEHGKAPELAENLLRAYAAEGRSIADHDTLVELAGAAGLDRERAKATLASDAYAGAVREDLDRAARLGVGGVPMLVIDGRRGMSAMESPDVLARMLTRSLERKSPAE